VAGNQRTVFDLDEYLVREQALDCHGNALRHHASSDSYLVSALKEDVFIVPRAGGPATRLSNVVPGGSEVWGRAQHGVQHLGDRLLLFANEAGSDLGGFHSGGPSTVLEYMLHSGEEAWRYETGLYSVNLGDAQRLPGGNTLVTISNAAIIREVSPGGDVVMQITGVAAFGYSTWRRSLYGAPEQP
jgi:hypothetical protein